MRDMVTQIAVLFILWSLAIELTAWAMQAWLGDAWWRKLLGERRTEEPQRQTVPIPRTE